MPQIDPLDLEDIFRESQEFHLKITSLAGRILNTQERTLDDQDAAGIALLMQDAAKTYSTAWQTLWNRIPGINLHEWETFGNAWKRHSRVI